VARCRELETVDELLERQDVTRIQRVAGGDCKCDLVLRASLTSSFRSSRRSTVESGLWFADDEDDLRPRVDIGDGAT